MCTFVCVRWWTWMCTRQALCDGRVLMRHAVVYRWLEQATSDGCSQRAGRCGREGGRGVQMKKREFVVRAGVKRRR